MKIACPHCRYSMELKGAKPGRFHPRCTACRGKFLLQIHDDPKRAPLVALESDPKAETAATGTVVPAGRTVAGSQVVSQSRAPEPTTAPAARAARTPRVSRSAAADTPTLPRPAEPVAFTADDQHLLGASLGGYLVKQKIGQGGMGAVYLARQLSLDRDVALKVLSPDLAEDPQFVARFTREAYAAAQLTHHNVVQIHDIGESHGVHFFSMEFVQGRTLSSLVTEHGKVDAEQAVGFALQAARGLKFAHEHGLVHRDIKPENLMLNAQGIVKVADLGLVKRAGLSEITRHTAGNAAAAPGQTLANQSMGTPAYMSPEQCADAAQVDHRADIYSLGCTLYDLLTGRPPFSGRTALEVMTKHQREPIVPPEHIVKDVPRSLSSVLMKMVAKRPDERFQSMATVITELENFLGVAQGGPFTPRQEHVDELGAAVTEFNRSAWARARTLLIGVFFLSCAGLAAFVGATRQDITSKVQWTGGFIGLAVLTTAAYFVVTGLRNRTHLFARVRQLVFGANFTDWAVWLLGAAAVCAVLVIFDQHKPWLIVSGAAVLLAITFHLSVDRLVARDRGPHVERVEATLKEMRLRGLEENALRQFVCKYSGRHWEEFYETLFGYEDKMLARAMWGRGERGRERPKFGAWRDPIVRNIDARITARREFRERQLLARIEARALRAQGIRDDLARKQARDSARALVRGASRARRSTTGQKPALAGPTLPPTPTIPGANMGSGGTQPQHVTVQIGRDVALESAIAQILSGAAFPATGGSRPNTTGQEDEEYERRHESWFKRRFGTPIDFICGPLVRVVLAVIVLAGFTTWWKQNSGQRAARQALEVVESRRDIVTGQVEDLKRAGTDLAGDAARAVEIAGNIGERPLRLFPGHWETANRFAAPLGGWNAGLAGLLLLFSAFFTGRLMAVLVIASAAIAMLGHRFALPGLDFQPAAWMSATAAVLVWVFGVMFFRERDGY